MQWIPCSMIECSGFYAAWPKASRLNAVDSIEIHWATLLADNGNVRVSRELTPAEMSRLSAALNDGTLSEEARRMRVAGLLNSVVLAETASRNFELGMAEQRGQTENLKR